MIYLQYKYNSGGRSGHAIKDILTVFILQMLIDDSIVLYDNSYKVQKIFSEENLLKYCALDMHKYDHIIHINNYNIYKGIDYKDYSELLDNIDKYDKKLNIKVEITNVFRILPYILDNWYHEKKINRDIFNINFLPFIRNLYYDTGLKTTKNIISIHIRRGDVSEKAIKRGFNTQYYSKIINILNNIFNIPIHIYSENSNSDDLHILSKYKNVYLNLGGIDSLKEDFDNLCRSRILILSSSGFSTIAAYLSLGSVLLQEPGIKHMKHIHYPSNFYTYSKDLDNFNEKCLLIRNK